ncbi:hypothetical protein ZEAMMB73_Zm00001d025602, partial [Zea mays]
MLEKSLREVLDLSCQSSCDTLDQASDVSNIPKGLSLLTRIVEGTNCCDSIPPRPLGVGEKPKRFWICHAKVHATRWIGFMPKLE